MSSEFMVQTDEFEGPLDTLLSLIRARELRINDISLAEVTDDYLEYIDKNRESLENMAEFVRIAATLVLAKSKSLLPKKTTDKENQQVDNLEDQLRAYRLVKKRAQSFRNMFGSQPAFSRQPNDIQPEIFAPGNTLTQDKLAEAIQRNALDLPDNSLPKERIKDTLPLDEEIDRLQTYCRKNQTADFSSLVRSTKKYHQVVSFVALLELHHQGEIEVTQPDNFAEITIRKQ